MVFFSCDGCGDILKKNQVDGHASRCRRCDSVSCVDCSVSFWGDDYRSHTSCISEAERYEKKLAKPKKRNPQEDWMLLIENCASHAPSHLRHYISTMSSLDNIPRKEKQFVNFASNSLQLRGSNKKIVDEIWNFLKQEREKCIAEKQKQAQQVVKEKEEVVVVVSDTIQDASTDYDKSTSSIIDVKKVNKITKKTLKKAPNKSMLMKELRKLVGKKLGLPKSAKKQLKMILLETAKTSDSKIKIDGKIICLH
mmetsp:Transcript_3439/g.3873  ORF Transcript_3439/g.3873 Transcript_3439/m.3873 type:complete len:252 (+) Transcript_3439:98-853(+)|eukprot:CAMPEP_0170915962 /NCGR_PEP_ID=MMETSP0735-20130129/6512_1 /TAXON_ID=186038 /ORGANISM="Fragilariopsis kerguelensis, Strain L26-C5" /LENGTH=251 /DNA_ID=CAMNT_0011313975 /DNA_START=335 /DNA_END=1090 /DNA_ORIENTATION=+